MKGERGSGHPATSERAYEDDETEWLAAVARYQAETGRKFLLATEYLKILKSLGYSKEPPARPPRKTGPPRRLDHDKIVELYRKGLSAHQVADHMGCCYETAREAIRRSGTPFRPPRRIDRTEAVRLYLTGLSVIKVGQKLKCSQTSVWTAVKRAGVLRKEKARPVTGR